MAYEVTPDAETDVGKPVKSQTQKRVVNNQINHEERIAALESLSSKYVLYNEYIINASQYSGSTGLNSIDVRRAPINFDLTTAIITVTTAGPSGTFEIDLLVGNTADRSLASSVFSTKPSVAFSAGDFAESSNAVFATQSITQSQWIFLDITSFQAAAGGQRLHVWVFGEPN